MTILLLLNPFTKVEESFNMQAVHDISYTISHSMKCSNIISPCFLEIFKNIKNITVNYDHHRYPGVVPRTFTGAIIISCLGLIIKSIISMLGIMNLMQIVMQIFFPNYLIQLINNCLNTFLFEQMLYRWILGLLVCISFVHFIKSLEQYDPKQKYMIVLFMSTQFHFIFYASRMLPNTFALIGVCLASSQLIRNRAYTTISILSVTTAIFRSDMIILLATLSLLLLKYRLITLLRGITYGLISVFISIIITIPIDSLLWNYIVWPEAIVLFFNTALNRSCEWGRMPIYWYFTVVLPKLFLILYPIIFIGICKTVKHLFLNNFKKEREHKNKCNITNILAISSVIFILLYSLLPHKELRFILPVFPLLLPLIINGLDSVPVKYRNFIFLCFLICNSSLTCMMCYINQYNYPGATALFLTHRIVLNLPPQKISQIKAKSNEYFYSSNNPLKPYSYRQIKNITKYIIYIDSYAAMNGITRFSKFKSEQLFNEMNLKLNGKYSYPIFYSKNQSLFNSETNYYTSYKQLQFDALIMRYENMKWLKHKNEYKLVKIIDVFYSLNIKQLKLNTKPFLCIFIPK